ncbi:integrase [Vibrio campbellii]|uniref:integrase n=1 Tax=Vibrio campbellii TaxID=680 RepID=UPI0006809541|nr:integrase [Vibrio campbellii]
MTDNVIRFKAKKELTGEQNLIEFIVSCRTHLTVFGKDNWHENKWNAVYGKRKVVARFSTNLKPSDSYNYEPIAEPFLDFAKAYIKHVYTDRPVGNLQRHFEAIRVLEEALILAKGKADILLLDGMVLEYLDEVFQRRISNAEGKNKAGYQMELILDFCRNQLITPTLPEWSNPYGKVKDQIIRVDEKGKEFRAEKLPSDEEMVLVVDLFREAPKLGVEAEYYSSLYVLLMTAPSRGAELTNLHVDNCLVRDTDRNGEVKLGIAWLPGKGGKEGVKWVPTVMEEIVEEAVERLKRISGPARLAAKFAEENPEQFMIHAGCITHTGFSVDAPLSLEQFNGAMGSHHSSLVDATKAKWIKKIYEENGEAITYRALGKYAYDKFTGKIVKWPFVDKHDHVKASKSLVLFRENEFHADFEPRGFSFVLPTVNYINDRFAVKKGEESRSLWVKCGMGLKSGDPITLTTHKARHWLSTVAESGGMDALKLAQWAGRARVQDNEAYDHRTEEEKADQVAALMQIDPSNTNILDKIEHRIPVTFEDIGKDLAGSAIVTELGICEHDYAMAPCQRAGDCETCKEMVCVKGFSSALELLKKRESEVESQLIKAMADHEIGKFGADRWVSNHGWRLAHIRTKIRILEDANVPDGTPIRIPEEYDPSPVKEALRKSGLNTEIVSPDELGMSEDLFNLLGM